MFPASVARLTQSRSGAREIGGGQRAALVTARACSAAGARNAAPRRFPRGALLPASHRRACSAGSAPLTCPVPPPQAGDIAALRAALGASLPATWDDIWLLRFTLSFAGDAAKQQSAARTCIEYRAKHAKLLADTAQGIFPPELKDEQIKSLCFTDFHAPTKYGEPISIVRAGLCSPAALLAVVSEEEFFTWMMVQKELGFIACDAATRKHRLLVKCITVVDLLGVTLASASSSASIKYQQIAAATGKVSESVYPQLLGKQVLLHPPRFFAAVFGVIKQFMSPRVVEKLGFCPGPGEAHGQSASVCPYARGRFEMVDLPTFLGGLCKCTAKGGCVCATPNERTHVQSADGAAVTVSVGARSRHAITLAARQPRATLHWEYSLAAKGIEFAASVQPEAGPAIELAPVRKHKAEEGTVTGQCVVPVAGTVTVVFDNSHSRLTSKSVSYSVAVIAAAVVAAGASAVEEAAAPAAEAAPAAGIADADVAAEGEAEEDE
jgi:hypothetical protein